MFNKLKKILGITPAPNYVDLLKEGAIIVDVRSKTEYAGGHIKGSKNIPLQNLHSNAAMPKEKSKPVITCCASGMRSASAKRQLQSQGYTNVYNGGSWAKLSSKLRS